MQGAELKMQNSLLATLAGKAPAPLIPQTVTAFQGIPKKLSTPLRFRSSEERAFPQSRSALGN
jgi:hypothetical protein